MRIVCLGGGPAGLYFSILAKKANPSWDITVVERNRPDDTFGWGVVFSDKTMDGFKDIDPETHSEITHAFRHWDDIDVFFKGQKVTSGGHGFCGIAQNQTAANSAEARRRAGREIDISRRRSPIRTSMPADYDLVIASDGAGSHHPPKIRRHFQAQHPAASESVHLARQQKETRCLYFRFRGNANGAGSICMRTDSMRTGRRSSSRRLRKNWLKAGIDKMEQEESIALCEKLFADRLDGNASDLECEAFEGLGRVVEVQSHSVREMVSQEYRSNWRCGAYGAFQYRFRDKTGDGRCDRSHSRALKS